MPNTSGGSLPTFDPATRIPLYQRVAESLQEYILHNGLQPGDKLPTEQELAQSFDVSRSTVREGFRFLQAQGIIDIRQRHGAVVKAPAIGDHFSQLAYDIRRTDKAVTDLWETRVILELGALPLVIERHDEDDINEMDRLLGEMERSANDYAAYLRLEHLFHKLILKASHNEIIIEFSRVIDEFFARPEHKDAGNLEECTEEHRRIRDAIASRDVEAAHKLLHLHLWRYQSDWTVESISASRGSVAE